MDSTVESRRLRNEQGQGRNEQVWGYGGHEIEVKDGRFLINRTMRHMATMVGPT